MTDFLVASAFGLGSGAAIVVFCLLLRAPLREALTHGFWAGMIVGGLLAAALMGRSAGHAALPLAYYCLALPFAIDVVHRVAPNAKQPYVDGFGIATAQLLAAGINTPLRLAHFLAQWAHETAGFTLMRESGSYRAARISEIFGVGKHSAAVTPAEAAQLANNGPALFERVYGLGNPKKARELGNKQRGDAWLYRGGGLPQLTGGGAYRKFGFADDPDAVCSSARCVEAAIKVWTEKGCNVLADRNDIREITRKINGGYNGYADRVAWFNKIWPVVRDVDAPAESWKAAEASKPTEQLQRQLVELGYDVKVDGRVGPKTTRAIVAFQKANGLRADGIPGKVTTTAIEARLSGTAPTVGSEVVPDAPGVAAPAAGGLTLAGLGDAGQRVVDQGQMLSSYSGLSDILSKVAMGFIAVGAVLIVVGIVRAYVIPAIWRHKVPVAA